MNIEHELKKEGIEVIKSLDRLTINILAKTVADKLEKTFPNQGLNAKDLLQLKTSLKDGDLVANISYNTGTDVFITTHNGIGLRFDINEVPILGSRASGVKGISLKNDIVVSGNIINNEDYISLITSKNTGKRIKLSEFERISRARKGIAIIRDVKTNPYYILKSFIINSRHNIGLKFKEDISIIKLTELPITDRYSTGSSLSKHQIFDVFVEKELENPKNIKEEKIEVQEEKSVSLESIDKRIMTIDDFLGDLDI